MDYVLEPGQIFEFPKPEPPSARTPPQSNLTAEAIPGESMSRFNRFISTETNEDIIHFHDQFMENDIENQIHAVSSINSDDPHYIAISNRQIAFPDREDNSFTGLFTENNMVFYTDELCQEDPVIYHIEPTYLNATCCCTICLDCHEICDMAKSECGHYFGRACFETWLSKQRDCPLCRKYIDHVTLFKNK